MVIESLLEFENDVHDMVHERGERLFNPEPLKRAPFPKGYIEKIFSFIFSLGLGLVETTP